jgi:hypothetical protein
MHPQSTLASLDAQRMAYGLRGHAAGFRKWETVPEHPQLSCWLRFPLQRR